MTFEHRVTIVLEQVGTPGNAARMAVAFAEEFPDVEVCVRSDRGRLLMAMVFDCEDLQEAYDDSGEMLYGAAERVGLQQAVIGSWTILVVAGESSG